MQHLFNFCMRCFDDKELCSDSLCCLIPFVWVVSGLLDLLCHYVPVLGLSGMLRSSAAPQTHGMVIATFWLCELFGPWPKFTVSGRPMRSLYFDYMYYNVYILFVFSPLFVKPTMQVRKCVKQRLFLGFFLPKCILGDSQSLWYNETMNGLHVLNTTCCTWRKPDILLFPSLIWWWSIVAAASG